MKKYVLLITLIPAILFAGGVEGVRTKLEELAKSEKLKDAQFSFYAKYVESGEVIASLDEHEMLAPASGLKLLTSAAALYYLGSDYRFKTDLYYTGEFNPDGILKGNLILKGDGDPSFGHDLVKGSAGLEELMTDMAGVIKKAGIKKIEGDIIGDNSKFSGTPIPGGWEWIDIGNYYGASVSALTIHGNLYRLYFKPGNNAGDPAEVLRIEPEVEGLTYDNYMKTGPVGSGDNGYIYGAPGQYRLEFRGTVPAGYDEFFIKGSIPEPPLYAVNSLKKSLEDNGVDVTGKAWYTDTPVSLSKKTLIKQFISPPLKDIVYIVNKKSNNLYTELLLKTIAHQLSGEGSTEAGIKLLDHFLDKLGVEHNGLALADGCGLARSNTVTTALMTGLLATMTKQEVFEDYYYSMAVAGDPDDLGYFKSLGKGTNVEKNARIKSGSINRVRSYSGYIKDTKGKVIVFSYIVNNFRGSSAGVYAAFKELLIGLSEL